MTTYQWAVIGAGPAGIATVGKLIDEGIPPREIAWIDPQFNVGDFGTIWRNVPSNTTVKLFLKFLHASPAFAYQTCPHDFALNQANPDETCVLERMAEPLRWVTEHLQKQVQAFYSVAEELAMTNRHWQVQLKNNKITAKNVV